MAVNCAILSYNGMAYFGFSGDVHAAPDLRRLEELVKQTFTELCDAAGSGRRRKSECAGDGRQCRSPPLGKVRTGKVRARTGSNSGSHSCSNDSARVALKAKRVPEPSPTEPENAPTERIVA